MATNCDQKLLIYKLLVVLTAIVLLWLVRMTEIVLLWLVIDTETVAICLKVDGRGEETVLGLNLVLIGMYRNGIIGNSPQLLSKRVLVLSQRISRLATINLSHGAVYLS